MVGAKEVVGERKWWGHRLTHIDRLRCQPAEAKRKGQPPCCLDPLPARAGRVLYTQPCGVGSRRLTCHRPFTVHTAMWCHHPFTVHTAMWCHHPFTVHTAMWCHHPFTVHTAMWCHHPFTVHTAMWCHHPFTVHTAMWCHHPFTVHTAMWCRLTETDLSSSLYACFLSLKPWHMHIANTHAPCCKTAKDIGLWKNFRKTMSKLILFRHQ